MKRISAQWGLEISFVHRSLPVAALILTLASLTAADVNWKAARPDYSWQFPQDHWPHAGYRNEWWYFTGHLEDRDDPTRRFGYQFTFFQVGLHPEGPELNSAWATRNLIMGHAAITDLQGRRHLFTEVLYRTTPFLGGFGTFPDPLIAWSRGPAGTGERWVLQWNGEAFDFHMRDERLGIGLELSTRPLKPLVLQGPNGYSRKGEEQTAASQYYSFPRLETEGTLRLGGEAIRVRGRSWMDKEFGSNQLAEDQSGWDWFSLQLDDGRDIMLYQLRDKAGAIDFEHGTLISPDGSARFLEKGDWETAVLSRWESPQSGAAYPARWVVTLRAENLELEIIPELDDQENRSRLLPKLFYWEGAVRIQDRSGHLLGRGYVELTGYGPDSRPPI